MLYGFLSAIVFVSIGIIYNLYPIKKINYNYLRTFFDSSIIWLVCCTFLAYFGSGFIFLYGISRLVIAFGFIISVILIFIVDTLYDTLMPAPKKKLLIINNAQNEEIIWSLHEFEHFEDIVIPFESDFDIASLLKTHKPSAVLILGDIPQHALQYIADQVTIAWVDMLHISQGMLLDDLEFHIARLGPVIGLQYRSHNMTDWDWVVKRICDIIGSIVGLIITSPIMLITALCIMIFDKGPVFYKHTRIGRNSKPFDYIKFRSMKTEYCTGSYFGTKESEEYWKQLQDSNMNVRKGELQKIQNDPRVTRIGRFIRKYSIDELPSLWNVLKGDMSLVGPRPHLDFEVARYQPWMKRLLGVKPGITCYGQIYGRDRLSFADEAKFDIYYIQNWNLLFDLYIIVATFKVLFKGR
jgi:exopolysaccharide biosynthesis polyprenyl glycosylphosphotransferase